jgi:hypothetical protein
MTLKTLYYVYNLLLASYGGFLVGALLLPQGMSVEFGFWLLTGCLVCQLLKEATYLVLRVFRRTVDEKS